jgi:hypothetical protein
MVIPESAEEEAARLAAKKERTDLGRHHSDGDEKDKGRR